MLAEALFYPFVLARRRPIAVGIALAAQLVIAATVQEAWANTIGEPDNPFFRFAVEGPLLGIAYFLVRSVAQSLPVALVFVAAAADLGFRTLNFKVGDVLRVCVLGVLYGLVFVVPPSLVQRPLADLARPFWGAYASWAVSVPFFILQSAAFSLFFLSWPRSIAIERLSIFPTWRLSNRAAMSAAVIFAVAIGTSVVSYLGSWVDFLIFKFVGGSVDGWFLSSAIFEWPRILGVYLIDAASFAIYAHVMPQRPERVADHF